MRPEFEDIPLVKTDERFEINYNGHTAFLEFEERDGKILLVHTEAPEALRGTGAAGALVEKVFQWIAENQIGMVPLCPYVKSSLMRKPEWLRIVAEPHKSALQ